jgi:ABC-type transport system involved in cytochrome c biogenesis permease subunit
MDAVSDGRPFAFYGHQNDYEMRQGGFMGIGVSIFLIAVGAVLAFAVNATSSAVDVNTVGWILMGVGFIGALLSLVFWSSWAGPGYWTQRRSTTVEGGPPAPY